MSDKTRKSGGRLWDREPGLWDAAQQTTIRHAVPPADPQVGEMWKLGGTAVDLSTRRLKAALWGPPDQLTLSLCKTDVWDRRRYFPPFPTVREMAERVARGDMPRQLDEVNASWCAYDFPCSKPVGQIIVRCADLDGAPQPVAVTHCRDGSVDVKVEQSGCVGELTWLPMITRDVIAVRGKFRGLRTAPSLRLYRHRDFDEANSSIQGALCNYMGRANEAPGQPLPETLKGYRYDLDKEPGNEALDPPSAGQDGQYFWIRQRMPPEKTFPAGFEYVMMGTLVDARATMETVEGQRGLGAAPSLRPDQKEWIAQRRQWWRALPNYDLISGAPGAAATAQLPSGPEASFTWLVAIVTSAESADPLTEARRRLARAAARGFDALVEENAAWYKALYDMREHGRIFLDSAGDVEKSVAEAFRSFGLPHPFDKICSPDPTRFEGVATYVVMEYDWDIVHGGWGFAEYFFTPEHVRHRSDRLDYYYKLAGYWLGAAQKNAREVYGLPGATHMQGYLWPILPDQCVHTTTQWEYAMELPAQFLKMLWDCFDYGGSEDFLAGVLYPSLRDTAIFYAEYAKLGRDNFYHVEPTVVSEHWGWTKDFEKNRDSISALCMFRWLLDRAAAASEILNVDADLRDRWREIASRMAPYPTWDTPEGPIFAAVPGHDPRTYNFGQLFPGVYPTILADEINLDSPAETREIMLRSARMVTGEFNPLVPILLGTQKGLGEPEQLVNSRSGRIHLFPGLPAGATAAFRDMQARGGFAVSAECVKGRITYVRVLARRDATCRIMSPWPGAAVSVVEETAGDPIESRVDRQNGECVTFAANRNRAYLLRA